MGQNARPNRQGSRDGIGYSICAKRGFAAPVRDGKQEAVISATSKNGGRVANHLDRRKTDEEAIREPQRVETARTRWGGGNYVSAATKGSLCGGGVIHRR